MVIAVARRVEFEKIEELLVVGSGSVNGEIRGKEVIECVEFLGKLVEISLVGFGVVVEFLMVIELVDGWEFVKRSCGGGAVN